MMQLADLLGTPALAELPAPAVDPLSKTDLFAEAQLLDIRFDAVGQRLGILLELRVALQLRTSNTGVVVATDATEIVWSAERRTGPVAWSVVSSAVVPADGDITVEFSFSPTARLRFRAKELSYYDVAVEGLAPAPGDYTAGEIVTASWCSTGAVEGRSIMAAGDR